MAASSPQPTPPEEERGIESFCPLRRTAGGRPPCCSGQVLRVRRRPGQPPACTPAGRCGPAPLTEGLPRALMPRAPNKPSATASKSSR